MSNPPLTRESLHQQVWTEPIVHVAKRLAISGRGLGKLCARYDIPVPPRGGWAKKQHGHKVQQIPLAPLRAGMSAVIVLDKESPSSPIDVTPIDVPPEIAFELRPENRILVPGRVARLHSLIARVRDALKVPQAFDPRQSQHPVGPGMVRINVSRPLIPRALRILDTIVRALEARRYTPSISPKGLTVSVLGESFHISVVEKTKQQKRPPKDWEKRGIAEGWRRADPYDLVPNGALGLRFHDEYSMRYELIDAPKGRVEDGLNRFVIKLVERAFEEKRNREERERERLLREEAARVRREEEVRREAEEAKEKQWDEWMAAWKKTQDIRAFERAVRQAIEPIEPGSKVEEWLRFADAYANRIDPLRQ